MKNLMLACLAAICAAGCEGATGPTMRPGENCLGCHGDGEEHFTLAGTVYSAATDTADKGAEGVTIAITDANGQTQALTSNSVGSFYTGKALTAPFKVELRRGTKTAAMTSAAPDGACNRCHTDPAANGAPGRLFIAP